MSALLSLANLRVSLAGQLVVHDVSLTVAPGEIVALLGANGAGKTTLMRAALGLAAIDHGRAALIGDDPARLAPRERARRAAYLPQRQTAAWPIAVETLVALGRFAYGAAPEHLSIPDKAAVDAALAACALQTLRHRPVTEISGGEKARAHLARALAQQAPLLVLDEPDAGLDPAQTMALIDIVENHARTGGGALFSTHDIALAARAAHRIVVMKSGRSLASGAPDSVLSDALVTQAYGRSAQVHTVDGSPIVIFGAIKT